MKELAKEALLHSSDPTHRKIFALCEDLQLALRRFPRREKGWKRVKGKLIDLLEEVVKE